MIDSPDLSVLVVSYNTKDLTLAAIDSFYRHSGDLSFEMIIVDNASSDGSCEALQARHWPESRLLCESENLGFARANNLAAGLARGRRLLLLNPDTLHRDGATSALWDFAERTPQRRIWGGRTLFEDGSLNPNSCFGRITLWSLFCSATGLSRLLRNSALFNPEGYGGWARDSERAVDIVQGSYLMIDRDLWERLGGFDQDFFMYAEEADLCLRAAALGARPAITPKAAIVHYGGASSTNTTEKTIKVMRGRSTLIAKHWSKPAIVAARLILTGWSLARLLGASVGLGDRGKWREIWLRRREWIAGYGRAAR